MPARPPSFKTAHSVQISHEHCPKNNIPSEKSGKSRPHFLTGFFVKNQDCCRHMPELTTSLHRKPGAQIIGLSLRQQSEPLSQESRTRRSGNQMPASSSIGISLQKESERGTGRVRTIS